MKRRQPKPPLYHHAHPYTPRFFWRTCDECRMQFKKESGWYHRLRYQCGIDIRSVKIYLCQDCAPTQEEADQYFKERDS